MKTKLEKLDSEKSKGDYSWTKEREAEIKEAKLKSKSATGNYTGLRVLDKIGNNTSDTLGIPKVDDKQNKK